MKAAAIGLRAKTGRAIAVALGGTAAAPLFIARTELSLIDPRIPETAEPFHAVMEMPWEKGLVAVRPYVAAIQKAAVRALAEWLEELSSAGHDVRACGVVGGGKQDPSRIGNYHIRAHAAEGRLFRKVLKKAAAKIGIASAGYREDELAAEATRLGAKYCETVLALGHDMKPWRADEKLAATAAWLALPRKAR